MAHRHARDAERRPGSRRGGGRRCREAAKGYQQPVILGISVLDRFMEPTNSIHPETRAAWRHWLEEHHARSEGVWVISYKKATGKPRMEYEDAVEEALCFGWIDSKPNKLDEERSMLWFAPRKPGTGWARPNKDRVERLLAFGLIAPAGLAKVEAAKKDGSWVSLDPV